MTEFRHEDLLDSLKEPFVFCDGNHVIRYMNRAARTRYAGKPASVGRSIFDCHNDTSNERIRAVCARLAAGEDEVLTWEGDGQRVYTRAVRDADAQFLGYFERFELDA